MSRSCRHTTNFYSVVSKASKRYIQVKQHTGRVEQYGKYDEDDDGGNGGGGVIAGSGGTTGRGGGSGVWCQTFVQTKADEGEELLLCYHSWSWESLLVNGINWN